MILSVTNVRNLQRISSIAKWNSISTYDSSVGEKRKLHTSKILTSKTRYSKPKLTHSYVHGMSDIPLSSHTVGSALVETVEKFPDHECLVFCEDGVRRTFSQFLEEVDKFAAGLIKLGFKKGDRVGIWGPSTLEWVITQFATGRIGAVLVNVNPAYQVGELAYVLRMVGCKGIVASAGFKTQDYYGMLHQVLPEIEKSDPGRIKSEKLPDLTTVIMMGDKKYPGAFSFPDVLEIGGSKEISQVHNICASLQSDDIINVQFTSGTTGHPKGATLTHHNIVNNAIHIGSRMGTDTDFDRILCQVPLYHCFGMVGGLMVMATLGAANIFAVPGYDPEASLRALEEEKCTSIYGTPTMYIDVCSHAERKAENKITHLTKGIMAGSPCPPEVIKRAYDLLGAKVQNKIATIEKDAFKDLSKISVNILNVQNNLLVHLNDDVFVGLTKLKILLLNGNKLMSITAELFAPLQNLRKLSLNGNKLELLPSNIRMKMLASIALAGNHITTVNGQTFSGMPRLSAVDLSNNQINLIHENAFTGLKRLKDLKLNGNQLKYLPDFSYLKSLNSVALHDNKWTCDCNIQDLRRWIEERTDDVTCFQPIRREGKSLKSFVIEDLTCEETATPSPSFEPATISTEPEFYCRDNCVCSEALKHINCNGQKYGKVPKKFPVNTELLDLRQNSIEVLESNSFESTPFLISLHLQNNGMTRVNAVAFKGLKKLVYLYLNQNKILSLNPDSFSGLDQLSYLFLDNNRITSLPANIFLPLTSIFTIYMQHNLLVDILPRTFAGASRLRWLYLSNNRINQIYNESFSELDGLQKLFLNHNQLITFPASPIKDMYMLNTLDVSVNYIETISLSEIKYSNSLETLNLAWNQIYELENGFLEKLANLKSLNASNNVLQNVPKLPQFINEIFFEQNPLKCECEIKELLRWIRTRDLELGDTVCNSPPSLKGRLFSDRSLISEVKCPRKTKFSKKTKRNLKN